MWFIVSLRLGDGELSIAGEKNVICLVKINGLLKALIQNVYPAPVLHYDTGYGTVEAEEVRIGLFACVCRQGKHLRFYHANVTFWAKIFLEQEKAARRGGFLLAAKLRIFILWNL